MAADAPESPEDRPQARLAMLRRLAAAALIWEQVWPPLATLGTVGAVFLAASWAGVWYQLPAWGHAVALGLFALAAILALSPLVRVRLPDRAQALTRIDRDSPDGYRAATSLGDRLAGGEQDETTRAMWALHQAWLARRVEALRVAPPSPGLARIDPRALRYAALLLALAAGLGAGSERYARFASAFDVQAFGPAAAPARIDGWIEPPAYAGKPPILLKIVGQSAPETIGAPEGSTLVVRADGADVEVRATGAMTPAEAAPGAPPGAERRFVLHGDGELRILRGGAALAAFTIKASRLDAPVITLAETPRSNLSGSLTLHYSIADAYGVESGEATFAREGEAGAQKHRLAEPPRFALALPSNPNGVGDARTTQDLSDHPWAGAEVEMTLHATGVSGRVGVSEPVKLRLPERTFTQPLARALVEQRRGLILDPDNEKSRVARVLAALTLAPEVFNISPSVYLGLRAASTRLAAARSDPQWLEVADLLWQMALQIEEGDASQAQRDLRQAEQQLRDALKRGASEDEIKQLMKQLRDAAQRYVAELARRAPREAAREAPPMSPQDLDALLNRFEDKARGGAKEDAEAMLDQLQDMFENLQTERDAADDAATQEMQKQLGELDKLMRDQQALRDDTFRRDQKERVRRAQSGAQPPGQDESEAADEQALQDRQQALNDKLAELKRRMKSQGMKGEKGFDDAESAMNEAERDLQGQNGPPSEGQGAAPGRGHTGKGDAVEAQGRALQALREGAQGLQKQMQGQGRGKGGYYATGRSRGQRSGGDPLGRGDRGDQGVAEGLLNQGPEAAARARRVLEELRRRLGDPNRPGEERDYLERLIEPR